MKYQLLLLILLMSMFLQNLNAQNLDSLTLIQLTQLANNQQITKEEAILNANVAKFNFAIYKASLKPQVDLNARIPNYSKSFGEVVQPNGSILFKSVTKGSSRTQRIDVRVISATNKDLEKMVALSTFREDLFYRINLIKIHLPPLRERKSDIPLLVDFYVNNLKMTYEQPNLFVHKSAMNWLQQQEFSGNIRELKNLVERTVLMANSDELTAIDFQQNYRKKFNTSEKNEFPKVGAMTLEEMEVKMVQKALDFHQYNISTAAKSLGITRNALYRRIEKFKLE